MAKGGRVIQSLTAADGSLANILGGLHFNFGFLLGPLDPNDLPSGRIEMDEISIWAPGH